MHDHAVMKGLMRAIEQAARAENARRVVGISVKLGALSHMTPAHFGEHFEQAASGTIAEGAALDIEVSGDIHAPSASDIVLRGIEVET